MGRCTTCPIPFCFPPTWRSTCSSRWSFPRSCCTARRRGSDRKSTRLNSSHGYISYAVFGTQKNTVTGIVVSLPLGFLLVLGRSSKLTIVRVLSLTFFEFLCGVPLISVLFFATFLLPLFLIY